MEAKGEVDLLGDPLRPLRDPRGRPKFAKTKENQLLVINLKAAGWTNQAIADFMGCHVDTLRDNFSRELQHGAMFLEGIALQALTKQMLDGNVSATKKVLEIAQAANAPKQKPKAVTLNDEEIGKKKRADLEAKAPPDGWGSLLPN